MTAPPDAATRLAAAVAVQDDLLGAGLRVDALLDVLAARAAELTGADGAVVELLDGEHIVYRATTGVVTPHLGVRFAADDCLGGRVARTGLGAVCDDSEDDDPVDRIATRAMGVRSSAGVPLCAGADTVGALEVVSGRPGTFGPESLDVLRLLAAFAGLAMRAAIDLERRDLHDPITGMAGRVGLGDRLALALARQPYRTGALAVLAVEVEWDGSPERTAGMVADAVRPGDVVARIDETEFAVVAEEVAGDMGAWAIARRLERSLAEAGLRCRVGVAVATPDSDPLGLLDAARAAMTRRPHPRHPSPSVA
jgi:GGDEF domain-containing protein